MPLRAVVVSDAIVGRNGVGTYYCDLVQQLQGSLAHISLIAPSGQERSPHVKFTLPMPGDSTQFVAYPKVRWLESRIEALAPDVVVIPTLGPYAYHAARIAEKHNMRICVAHHTNLESLVQQFWHPWIARWGKACLHRLANKFIRSADTVVTMDVESLEQARDRGASRVRQMGTPLSTMFLEEPTQRLCMKPPKVIFLGRLSAEKRVDQVLQAARSLPHFRFQIGGDGPLRRMVQRESDQRENLEYLGWLHRDRVLQYLDRSDILVLPSRLETFGTVALEALARRRLVVVSRGCGIAHWPDLAQGLFTIQDQEELPQTLERLAAMPEAARLRIARRGWAAVTNFNAATLGAWLQVLAETADFPSSSSRKPSIDATPWAVEQVA